MAKFIATSSSYFQPFSYDELIKPILMQQEAHGAAQDTYDQLAMETSALENYISQNEDDAQARRLYDNYMTKLQTLQDNLWKNGVTAQTRRDLHAARNAYASDITRLAKAVENRQARSKEYWDIRHNNPDMVMGADPGLSGLDYYLNDDNYGRDYFSYDSGKFESAVADEWRTRAKDMLRGLTDPNGVVKNPRLEAMLTRVIQQGVTNAEVSAAGNVVDDVIDMTEQQRSQYYDLNKVDPIVRMLSESLVSRYDSTGIRSGNVDASERARLLNRGKAGLSAGILGTKIEDFQDPEFALNQELKKARLKYEVEHPEQLQVSGYENDSNSTIYDNTPNAKRAESKLSGYLGPSDVRVSYKGKDVRLGAASSALVYSEDLRQRNFKEIGFDIGRDGSTMPSGEFVGNDDVVYEVMYNPKVKGPDGTEGAVLFRKKGTDKWFGDSVRTEKYKRARKQYEDNIEFYKKNYPQVYNAAKKIGMDPDKQYKIYEENGIMQNTSITDFEDLYNLNSKNKSAIKIDDFNVATRGTDKGDYIGKIADYIAGSIKVVGDKGDQTSKDSKLRIHDGQATNLHRIINGVIDKKTIRDAGDVFKFKDGKITNIQSVDIDSDGLYSGYIKVLTDANEWVAVGLDMIRSNRIKGIFDEGKKKIAKAATEAVDDEAMEEEVSKIVDKSASLIKNALWDLITQDKPSTNKEDNN